MTVTSPENQVAGVMLEDGESAVPADRAVRSAAPPKEEEHWTVKLLRLYSEGASDAEVRKDLDITLAQFDEYMANVSGFSDLVSRGREYALAWWEKQGRVGVATKNNTFPTALYSYQMANRYNWSNKNDNRNTETLLSADRAREELRKAFPELVALANITEIDPRLARKAIANGN